MEASAKTLILPRWKRIMNSFHGSYRVCRRRYEPKDKPTFTAFNLFKMSNKRLLTACTSRNVCKPCFLVAFDGTPKHESEIQIIPIGSFLFLAANNPSMRFKATRMRTSNIWKQIFSGKSWMRIKEFQLEFLFLSLSWFIKF